MFSFCKDTRKEKYNLISVCDVTSEQKILYNDDSFVIVPFLLVKFNICVTRYGQKILSTDTSLYDKYHLTTEIIYSKFGYYETPFGSQYCQKSL